MIATRYTAAVIERLTSGAPMIRTRWTVPAKQ
jgi:hypothetical protein